jgi:hypothetical protein
VVGSAKLWQFSNKNRKKKRKERGLATIDYQLQCLPPSSLTATSSDLRFRLFQSLQLVAHGVGSLAMFKDASLSCMYMTFPFITHGDQSSTMKYCNSRDVSEAGLSGSIPSQLGLLSNLVNL